MSTRAPLNSLHSGLSRPHADHARRRALRFALRGAAAIAVAVVLLVLAGLLLPLSPVSAAMRLGVFALVALASLAWAALATARSSESLDGFLERVESRFPEVRSWLRNALDLERHPPAGTSAELASALRAETVRRLATVPIRSLRPAIAPRLPLLTAGGSLLVLLLATWASPQRTLLSWNSLWQPSLAAPPIRLAVEPGSVRITPGASLVVRARVWGTAHAPKLSRDAGESPSAEAEGTDHDGARRWRFELAQLTRPSRYRVEAGNVRSPIYSIDLAGEPQPVGFEIEVRPPAYARLPVQRGAATRGDLEALRGSRAVVEVTFDRDLTALTARLDHGNVPLEFRALSPRRWRGEVPVREEGIYELAASAPSGAASYRYRIAPLADAPPVITVRVPERDVDLPAGQQVPLDVLAQDDLGLTELKLQFRKEADRPWADVPLARFAGQPREGEVRSRWDASGLGLLPGESASFRFAAYDNNAISGRGLALSQVFELRFPSLSEVYKSIEETHAGVQQSLEKLADQTRELQKNLERMERQAPKPGAQSSPAYERSQDMKSALERQQEINQQMNQALSDLKQSLEQANERDAFHDELQRKMQELADLMKQIQSPEFKEALRKMQDALERMDRRAMEQQLPEWRDQNKEMLANLERTIELLKNLRQEEQIESLARRADELAQKQDALNQEHQSPSNPDAAKRDAENRDLAQRQSQAADDSKQLAQDTKQLSQQLDSQQEQQQADEAAQELEQNAAPEQQDASEQAGENQKSKASQSGQQASQSIKRAASKLQQMAQNHQQQQQQVDLAAVRRAAQDLVSLQRATQENLDSNDPASQRADRQTDLADGTARVADSLSALAEHTPFISPRLHEALGHAMESLSQSGRELDTGNRERGEQQGQEGSTALNQAVLELRRTEQSMCQKPGQSQGKPNSQGGSMAQRMGQMSQDQSRLNQETQGVARRLSQQMEQSMGNSQELQRIAQEQQRLREQLEQIAKEQDESRPEEPKLLGRLDQTQQEMKEVEEALRDGQTDDEIQQKQQHILSKLLDAQRSVNRRDYEPQRESRPGEDLARSSPAPLPADLLRENDRLRLDLLKADADRYPAQYRTFVESYLRALNGRSQ